MNSIVVGIRMNFSSDDSSSHLLGEPLLGIIGGDSLMSSEFTLGMLSLCDSLSSSGEDHVEVHTENTGVGIVLNSEIDMLINTKSEVAYLIKFSFSFLL
jgi:hypothetical protein